MKMPVPLRHFVNGNPLEGPIRRLRWRVRAGCFWGAERKFWARCIDDCVGYAAADPEPDYEEACGGQTGHTEVVLSSSIRSRPAMTGC